MKKMKFKGVAMAAIVLLLLFSHPAARAQFGFSLGPKGGVALTTFRGTDANNINGRTTGLYGIFANIQLGKVIALQPEFLVTKRGADVTSNNTRNNIRLNYFEVPVLLKIRFPLANEVIFPHILLGPNFMYRTNLNLSSTDTQSGTVLSANKADIRRSDVGALVGAGIDIQTRGNGVFFTLDGRYGWGFVNVNTNSNMITLKNAGWMFAAGIGFRVGNSSNENY
jgi:hypothetical protein